MSKLEEMLANELREAKVEMKNMEEELKANKESFANTVKSSLGNDIKGTLSSIPVEKEKKPKKDGWFKRTLKKIARTCS